MNRQITQELLNWKNSPLRKPLIIRGARQVGKSYSIVKFGEKEFENRIHVINFEKNPEFCKIFNKNFDIKRIISSLELISGKKININEDLIFFDEVQECPKAILSLRYFYEEIPKLHLIAAGSLLEFALKDISFPVGRVQIKEMFPMNFHEYLMAIGNEVLSEKIISEPENLPDYILEKILEELYNYYIVGGMPEAVKTYANSKRIIDVFDIQDDLITTFRQDFSKYSGHSDKRCLDAVLNSVAKNVGRQIKYSKLTDDFSNPTIKKAFELLETARLFAKVKSSSPVELPLETNSSEKIFKAVFLDIGLLARINGFSRNISSKKQMSAVFNGMMAEQFVGQEILSSGQKNLFYWSRRKKSSNAETDYLVEIDGEIIPVEVKNGASGSLKSLHLLLKTYANISRALVFSENNFSEIKEQKLTFAPLFYAYKMTCNKQKK